MKPSNLRSSSLSAAFSRSAVVLLLTNLGAGLALAQEKGTLEEVIVTAQKREQKLQDVPTVVNALSGAALRASSVTEVNQLSTLVPGLHIVSDQTGRNTQIKIRGVGPDDATNVRPSVGFFYNDIPMMTQLQGGQSVASDLDLADLARVEVLKGPQSTLFGESVTSGAVSFTTRRPSVADGVNGRVSVNVGNHDVLQYRAAFGAPIGDKIAVRISGFHAESKDQVLNTVDNSRRKLESEGYTAQVLFQPSDDWKFILEHNRRMTRQAGGSTDGQDALAYGTPTIDAAAAAGIALTPPNPFDRKIQVLYPFRERLDDALTSLHATWNITDRWSLTSITGYQTNFDSYGGDGLLGGYNASTSVQVGFWAKGVQKIHYTTEEVRVDYAGEKLNSMLGVYWSSQQAPVSRGDFGFIFPGFVFPLVNIFTTDRKTDSIFTHNSFKFTDSWELVFGGRYTKEKATGHADLVSGQGDYSGNHAVDLTGVPLHVSDVSAWGGTLKLLYHVNDEITAYAGVDRGFLLGGINGINQPNYNTEVAYNYEIGLKGAYLDNTLRLNADIYETKYNGYQVVSYDSRTLSFITQNADVTGKGVEIESQWLPIRQLTLGANLAFNDIKFDSYRGAICDNYQNVFGSCPNDPVAGAQDLTGKRLSQAPRWSANLNAQYSDTLGTTGLDWYLRGEYDFRGTANAHPVGTNGDPRQRIPSYGLFNASLGLLSEHGWEVILWGKNLTNKDYFLNIIRQPVGGEGGFVTGRIGMERSGGVTVSYSF